jgi:hypothetical protein
MHHIHEYDVTSSLIEHGVEKGFLDYRTWGEKRLFRVFSSVSFLLENKRRNRPKDARTVSVERQRIFHRNRIQHQCLRERASVQEKYQSRILTYSMFTRMRV